MNKLVLIEKVIKHYSEATAIKMLSCLIYNADEDFEVHMSYSELVETVGKDKRTIYRYIKALKEQQLIDVTKLNRRNVYHLNIDNIDKLA